MTFDSHLFASQLTFRDNFGAIVRRFHLNVIQRTIESVLSQLAEVARTE